MPLTDYQALHGMSPSDDFRTTVDTTRLTKAIYIGADTLPTMTIHNEVTNANIEVPIGGEYHPLMTKTAMSESGYTIIYLY